MEYAFLYLPMTEVAWNNEERVGTIKVRCQDTPVDSFPVLWKSSDKYGHNADIFAIKRRDKERIVGERFIEITLQRFSERKVDASLYYVHLRHPVRSSFQILLFPSVLLQLKKNFDTKNMNILIGKKRYIQNLLFTSIGKFPTGVSYSVHLDKAQPWR